MFWAFCELYLVVNDSAAVNALETTTIFTPFKPSQLLQVSVTF